MSIALGGHVPRDAGATTPRATGATTPRATDATTPRAPAPLRVACYMHSLAGGGVERMRLNLLRQLESWGVRTQLLLHEDGGALRRDVPYDIPVTVLGSGRTRDDLLPLMRLLRRERPDALLVSLGHNNVVAMLAKLLSFSRCNLVVCQHNALTAEASADRGYRLLPALYRLLAPLAANHVVAVSHGVADDMASRTGLARARIGVIHNPVIGPDFAQRANAPLDDPWFGPGAPPVFVTAGRLVPQKDHETLLRAFAMHRSRRAARLLVLGEGPLLETLEAHARALGVADDIRFAGFQPNPLPFMREAEAFVLSSSHEGLGNVLVEALACGTPVISTDCPHGPAEILEHGRFGTLVPVGDVGALAGALALPHRDAFPAALLRARADAFTVERAAHRYLALLREPDRKRIAT